MISRHVHGADVAGTLVASVLFMMIGIQTLTLNQFIIGSFQSGANELPPRPLVLTVSYNTLWCEYASTFSTLLIRPGVQNARHPCT